MRTIMVELFDDGLSLSNDTLGRAGEKNVVQFSINFDALRDTGLTTATLLYQPRNSPVLAMPSVDIPAAGRLISQVPDWAMSMFGVTQVQLQLTGEGVETRSYIWHMRVERSLINYGDKPTPVQDWLKEVRDVIDDAASLTGLKILDFYPSFEDLAVNVTEPSPGDAYATGDIPPYDVYVYGETSGWVNIGPMNAGGGGTGTGDGGVIFIPSVSPVGTLSWENNGDLPNPEPVNLMGPRGAKGDKGDTGARGPEGIATVPRMSALMDWDTGKSIGYTLEWALSTRPAAPSGVTILHGTSPKVAVEETDDGHRVTITDADGAHSFDVLNGDSADEERFAALEHGATETDGRISVLEESVAETDARVSVLEQDMAEVKKITDNFGLFVPKFANTAEGETLVLTDSAEGALQGITVYGKTVQDGTPTPDAPVPLVSVGDDGAVDVTIEGSGVTQSLTLSTPNGLPSVGDVCDEIDLERGVYVQRVQKLVVDSVKEVYDNGGVWYAVIRPSAKGKPYSPVASTHFVGTTGKLNAGNVVVTSTGNIQAALVDQTIQTADAWNAWLAAQTVPLEFVYTLATTIETPLSAEEIAAFKAIKTHYPTTTIYNDESARMVVKYAADTKNYIDQKLATLAAAMVNNL